MGTINGCRARFGAITGRSCQLPGSRSTSGSGNHPSAAILLISGQARLFANGRTPIAGRWTLSTNDDRRVAGREPEYDERASERLTLFSDAVAAIAITLLAIDLPVPEGATTRLFWSEVHHNSRDYVAFLISFVIIANVWSAHHDIFRYVKRVDARLREYNMVWLLTIVLIPFATRLLNPAGPEATDARALRYGFYAVVQVVESGALLVMLRYMVSHRLAPDFPAPVVASMTWRSWSLVTAFALSIPVFILTSYAWLIWIAAPMLLGRIRHHRPPAAHSQLAPPMLVREGHAVSATLMTYTQDASSSTSYKMRPPGRCSR